MPSRIGFICPTHKHDDYTARAIQTFFKYTPDGYCIVVDDASPYWTHATQERLAALLPQPRGDRGMLIHRFKKWGGLTRSWNHGLKVARQQGLEYCIAGNNDILFTEGWQHGLIEALDAGYALVGPLSNAPGETSKSGAQEIWRYVKDFRLTDDQRYLDQVAAALRAQYAGMVVGTEVNGFFTMAKTSQWWEGRFDDEHVFCPRNDFNSKGEKNPTPLMTLNEDELQGRWRARGWKFAAVASSFIFHYRAVTRGKKYCKGRWFRLQSVRGEAKHG